MDYRAILETFVTWSIVSNFLGKVIVFAAEIWLAVQ